MSLRTSHLSRATTQLVQSDGPSPWRYSILKSQLSSHSSLQAFCLKSWDPNPRLLSEERAENKGSSIILMAQRAWKLGECGVKVFTTTHVFWSLSEFQEVDQTPYLEICTRAKSFQSWQLCGPIDCSPPSSSIHGILQASGIGCYAPLQGISPTQG